MSASAKPRPHTPLTRVASDMGPLVLFFATYEVYGIYAATAVFMAAVFAALGYGYWRERRLSPVPLFTAVLVLIFGGLTLYLKDATFIKMKPTVLYAFFGFLLVGGLRFKRFFVKYVFEHVFDLYEEGWRTLTWLWGIFFLALAVLNEVIWRSFPTDIWVDFKVFGIMPLIFLFALAQTPLVMKYEVRKDGDRET